MLNKSEKVMFKEDGELRIGEVVGVHYHIRYHDEEKRAVYILQKTREELALKGPGNDQ